MPESRETEVLRLEAKIADLKTEDIALEKRGADLKREMAIYDSLAEPSHVPSPTGGTDSNPSLVVLLKKRELADEIDHNAGERKRIADELPAAETALTAAKTAEREASAELTKSTLENSMELATSKIGPLDGYELGGTAPLIAEGITYGLVAAPLVGPYIEHVIVPQIEKAFAFNQAAADDLARPYEISDELKLMHEETVHQQNLQDLNGMKEQAAEMRKKDLTDKEISQAVDDTKARFKEQDEALAKMHEERRVSDEGLREQQDGARAAMEAETNAKRREVVQEVLAPMAERNVQQEHAERLGRNAANNQQNLEMYGSTLEGRPDAAKAQQEYVKFLEQDQKDLQKTLDTQRSQDVQREVGVLQQQHFPEVTPPAMSGPAVPPQSGPAGPGM